MQEIENLRSGLQKLGPDVTEINVIVEDEPGSWQILFEDGHTISLHYHEDKKTIEFIAALGMPDAGRELEVLRAMLCYQLLWRGRSQPRIAIDADIGSLLCLCEVDADLVDSPEFEEHILTFWVQTAGLSEMVQENIPLSLPQASPESMHLHA